MNEPTSKVVQATSCYRPEDNQAGEPEVVTTIVCEDGSVWTKGDLTTRWELLVEPFRNDAQKAQDAETRRDRAALARIKCVLREAGYHVPDSPTDLGVTIEVMLQSLARARVDGGLAPPPVACPECRGAGQTTTGYTNRTCTACGGRGTL